MTGLYVMIAVCIALLIACIAMCVLLLKKSGGKSANTEIAGVREENERLKNEIDTAMKINNSMLLGTLNVQSENIKSVG